MPHAHRHHPLRPGLGLSALLAGLLLNPVAPPAAHAADTTPCDRGRAYRDLNGDGLEDAVVGDPYATVAGQAQAGTVTVFFGATRGRIGDGPRRTLTQADLGQQPEASDHFGWAVRLSRTSDGGCYGILIGAPGEDVDGQVDAGVAHVVTFDAGGQDQPTRDSLLTVDQGDVGGTPEAGDEFGYAVAARGGSDEYAVDFAFGAPGENSDAGVVNTSDSGHLGSGVQRRQGSGGVPGTFQAGDRFGEVLAYDRSFLPVKDDDDFVLLVGAPGDTVSGRRRAGSVTALTRFARPRVFTQDTPGVPGTVEAGDHFGASLAQSQLPPLPDPRTLAIGAPGEDVGDTADAGSVTVLKRSDGRDLPATVLTQETPGVAGRAETGDAFGTAVAYRDDRTLAVGIPGEDLGTVRDAGSLQVVRVGRSRLSFPLPSLTEDSPGTPGVVRSGSRFGAVVVGLPASDVVIGHNPPASYGEALFAIGSPLQAGGSVVLLSDDPLSDAPDPAPRAWLPTSGSNGRFGWSVG